jgi:excisionase family DNA binding protein
MAEITKLLTPAEVGTLLQIHSKTVQRMAARREIPSLRVGRYWRFAPAEILRWISAKSLAGIDSPTTAGLACEVPTVALSLSHSAR